MNTYFKNSEFARDVKVYRGDKSMREIEKDTGISPSTISRIERGNIPDLVTYAIICNWMKAPMGKYFSLKNNELSQILASIIIEVSRNYPPGHPWGTELLKRIDNL